jgi:hypothetical protein
MADELTLDDITGAELRELLTFQAAIDTPSQGSVRRDLIEHLKRLIAKGEIRVTPMATIVRVEREAEAG